MTPADRLAVLLQHRTVSDPSHHDPTEFAALRETLSRLYPLLHSRTERIDLGHDSLLFRWRGHDSTAPLVLMAHHDVVPAPAEDWRRDPFGGEIADGSVHGRGALDDKGPLVCVLDAVEGLLADGHQPRRDIYVLSGADEETDGHGAALAAAWMKERGIEPWLVADEGGAVVTDFLPEVSRPAALVAIAEKGTVDLRIVARGAGGHSSTPARGSAVERLSEAVIRICRSESEALVGPAVREMLRTTEDVLPPPLRAIADDDADAIASRLRSLGPEMAAMAGTTMAVTRLAAGHGDNVLARDARASVNARLAPGDTPTRLQERLTALVGDLDVHVEGLRGDEPSPVSPVTGPQWDALRAALDQLEPSLRVVPYLQSGSTDSRYFATFSGAVYRFAPLLMTASQRGSIHGVDESVRIDWLERGIAFHRTLITASSVQ